MIAVVHTKSSQHRPMSAKPSQKGFSLIELMIAITLGLLLLAGLVTLFASNSSTRAEIDKSSRQIENGRYALQVLRDEIHHAGYLGALASAPVSGSSTLSNPCSTTLADVQNSIFAPIQGYAGKSSASALASTPTTAVLSCLDATAAYKPNTAVLVVRRANTNTAVTAFTAGQFNIQISGCAGDAVRYVLDSDSAKFILHKNTSPGCLPITTAPTADVTTYLSRIYFVSTCSGLDCTASDADSLPTLKRIDLTTTGTTITPIVDGIENLQLEYGIDTTGNDGIPDVYTNTSAHAGLEPSGWAEWSNVVSVRVYLLARSIDFTTGYTDFKTYNLGPVSVAPGDNFKRHAYTELVRVNNVAGRRE